MEMTKEQKERLSVTDMVFYRALPADSKNPEDAVEVSTSFCSLVRGFEPVDRSTLILHERLRVVPGSGASIIGLQLSSDTNFFHAKLNNGDECDISVIQKLFPTTIMQVHVSLQQPTALMTTVRYNDLKDLQEIDKNKNGKKTEAPQKSIRKVKNADGEWVEEEVEIEEKTFFQKYWMYLVVPFALQVIQGLIKKVKKKRLVTQIHFEY
ncbi:hypothetical protein STCU_05216 [Strigomonas culicis]|uniref:ER membrane protein complex subunit 10 n=1 Tax=Strigomonas culicis TaxID=28005 RepID=S9UHR2_9TRYP|nr:hypothetical protein STCU_05216 [Strigomonas culicis]|eukprot:EPY28269.1 hypothetical protein STCU_05216 [Strigomonas culicis]